MKRSRDIEHLRLTAELQAALSSLAFYKEKAENSVSREEFEAVIAERDSAIAQKDSAITQRDAAIAERDTAIAQRDAAISEKDALAETYGARIADLNRRLGEHGEAYELLKSQNADFKTMWEFWQRHHFAASSETMTDMMDKVVGKLPTSRTAMLADILSTVDRINHACGTSADPKLPVQTTDDRKGEKDATRQQDRKSSAGRNCKKTKCLDVREILGPDLSDVPQGFKVIMRNGSPDATVIEVIFMEKARTYSKKHTVVRGNVPGHDPVSSKHPPRLFGSVPVDPAFASFCLEMKFGYNMPENLILEMLAKAGCRVPQPTLNRWMHAVMEGLSKALMPGMVEAIRQSRFTHNDETRILVRSRGEDETEPSYKTEYIHGINSPEARLFLMLYDRGSRSHTVQLDIFRDSALTAFLADRCPLYTALVMALSDHPPIRGVCWVHFRRYLLHAYMQDPRLKPMVLLTARLFAAEKLISGMNLTETQRVRECQSMCRPLVEAMFSFMRKVREAGPEYGVLARRAADYLLNDTEGFSAFLSCGLLEIGNNAVERCFRNIAKGRANWLQCGSHDAARHTAFMYSLSESCAMNGIDFGLYIETVLRRILDGGTDYHAMLPNVIVLPDKGVDISAA